MALARGLDTGGWVPKGRLAEDGPIPPAYTGLVETESVDPAVRTVLNVRDSDATLLLSHGPLAGGSLLSFEEAVASAKPVLHLDLDDVSSDAAVELLRGWLVEVRPGTLNVAGPRASEDPAIADATGALLHAAFSSG